MSDLKMRQMGGSNSEMCHPRCGSKLHVVSTCIVQQ